MNQILKVESRKTYKLKKKELKNNYQQFFLLIIIDIN
jgi:hypothetical protein